jgi:Family of unknown function (DUF5317)
VLILWAIPIGLIAGWLLRGSIDGLANLRFRWPWLALGGLLVQVVLFSPAGDTVGAAGGSIYVISTAAVLVAVVRNRRLTGMPIVALGALSNLAAIVTNGGAMPADPAALSLAGLSEKGHTNSVVVADPALRPLTDVFAAPAWFPLANVFSIGDVLIAVGIAVALAAAMRRSGPARPDGPASHVVSGVPETRSRG